MSLKTKNKLIDKIKCFEIKKSHAILLGFVLLFAKLILANAQKVYLSPTDSVLDDTLMFNLGYSISKGEWLGGYGYLTLSKHSFFALWLAMLNKVGIPFLLAGQILWAIAAFAAAIAFAPVLNKNINVLFLYTFLLFNPASVANPAPYGFITRVYRDNIFPSLCLFAVAGISGFALRYKIKLSRSIGWLLLCGLALGMCRLNREDGWWISIFVVAAIIILFFVILKNKDFSRKEHVIKILSLFLPFVLFAGCGLSWRAVNYNYYGRFIISDFSAGEFADAYGALTRIEHEEWDYKIDVPLDVRQKLYNTSPLFAELEQYIESESYYKRYGGPGYSSGSFYWVLRKAADRAGYYSSPQKSAEYFNALAQEVNSLCNSGVLKAGSKRSSVNPPLKAEYIIPVNKEAFSSIWFCLTYRQCQPQSLRSVEKYEGEFVAWEEFLNEKPITAAKANSDEPYFSFYQRIAYKILDIIRIIYTILQPIAFALALIWLVLSAVNLFKSRVKGSGLRQESMLWFICMGLLCCSVLRAYMVAFVSVSSFGIGTYIMYLASIHPMLIIFSYIGTLGFINIVGGRVGTAVKK